MLTGELTDKLVNELNPIDPLSNSTEINTDELRIEIATSLALLVGLLQFLTGVTGLGILTSFFSDTFISSYTCGSAVHVIVSQVKDIFGIKKAAKYEGPLKVPKVIFSKI